MDTTNSTNKLLDLITKCVKTYNGKTFNGICVTFFAASKNWLKPNIKKFLDNGKKYVLPECNDDLVGILSDMAISNIVIKDLKFKQWWSEGELDVSIFIDESTDYQTNIEWDFIDELLTFCTKYNSMMR